MPLYLDTTGKPLLSIGICARCSLKMALSDMIRDPNSPGLMVHRHCADQFDPWRLPAAQVEIVGVPFARPDVSIATSPSGFIMQDGDGFLLTQDGLGYMVF